MMAADRMILYAKLAVIIATDDHLAAGDLDRLSPAKGPRRTLSLASILAITPQTDMTASQPNSPVARSLFQ